MKKSRLGDEYIAVSVGKSQARFTRVKKPQGADGALGHYFVILNVTPQKETVYIPLSIASGKKTVGFLYLIEGTGLSSLDSAKVEVQGEGVGIITLGTLRYAKIPPLQTASFRIQVDIKGKIGKSYTIALGQISYKLAPTDVRYKKYVGEVRTKTLKFQ